MLAMAHNGKGQVIVLKHAGAGLAMWGLGGLGGII